MGEDFNLDAVEFLDGVDELFGDTAAEPAQPDKQQDPESPGEKKETIEKTDDTTEVQIEDGDDLFGDDEPESVGGDDKAGSKAATDDGDGTSPKDFNAYSSFAKAMKGDGLFQFLDDEVIDKIDDADSFAEAFDDEINKRLDDVTRRVKEALDAEIPVDSIRQFEGIIKRLEAITEDQLSSETEQASRLRQNIIYQDYLNRGFSEERAKREVKRSVESGSDKEDAKDALESNKQFYQDKYDDLIAEGRAQREAERKKVREEAAEFRKAILEKDTLFGSIEVDKATRQKAYDAMTRVVGKDSDGSPVTAVQKFADENPVEFRSVLGLMWTLTNGFKDLGKIVQKNIDNKVRSNLKEIEKRIIGSTPRGGSPRFAGGESETDVPSRRGWTFDI